MSEVSGLLCPFRPAWAAGGIGIAGGWGEEEEEEDALQAAAGRDEVGDIRGRDLAWNLLSYCTSF